MAENVNGYSVNQPGEASDWSSREYALLSAFARLMPTSGSNVISANNQHSHTFLTDNNGNYKISATSGSIVLTTSGDFFTTDWIDYSSNITTATCTGWSSMTENKYEYKIVGKVMYINVFIQGESNSSIVRIPTPRRLKTGQWYSIPATVINNATAQDRPGLVTYFGNTTLDCLPWFGNTDWVSSGSKSVNFNTTLHLE